MGAGAAVGNGAVDGTGVRVGTGRGLALGAAVGPDVGAAVGGMPDARSVASVAGAADAKSELGATWLGMVDNGWPSLGWAVCPSASTPIGFVRASGPLQAILNTITALCSRARRPEIVP